MQELNLWELQRFHSPEKSLAVQLLSNVLLDFAGLVLKLADNLLDLAFGFELLVARRLACNLLGGAEVLLDGAVKAVTDSWESPLM